MPLNRPHFDVYVNGLKDADCHHVTITHQDQLRAEAALVGLGVDTARALALTSAWCWAALQRLELHKGPLKRFLDIDCAGVQAAAEGVTEETVDPTQRPADIDSASSLPGETAGPESTG